ncbi:hypothetical protein Hanom_Chr06g00519681 [Helianthus anomalus]
MKERGRVVGVWVVCRRNKRKPVAGRCDCRSVIERERQRVLCVFGLDRVCREFGKGSLVF